MLSTGPRVSKLTVFALPGDSGIARIRAKGIPGLEFSTGDIADKARVAEAIKGHSHVIHLAGMISYWGRDLERLTTVNVRGAENVAAACAQHRVERLVHISSVGAVGMYRDGRLANETTPFNWPQSFHYMTTKHAGQQAVQSVAREKGLNVVILNPASLMGPGDPDPASAHNQLYARVASGSFWGCFAGGLAVTDVRDLASVSLSALSRGTAGESYLVVGSNVTYVEVVRAMGACLEKKVHPFRVPPVLLTGAGRMMELWSAFSGSRPLLTSAYGKLSGWHGYYSNEKSVRAFEHRYIPFAQTIAAGCAYYSGTHAARAMG
jgi:dihydroflavonol-4-reductase